MRTLLIAAAAIALAACAGVPRASGDSLAGVAEIRPEVFAARLTVLTPVEQRLLPLYSRRAAAERTAAAEVRAGRMSVERGVAVRALAKDAGAKLQAVELAESRMRSGPAAQQGGLSRELQTALAAAERAVADLERLVGGRQ